MSFIDTNELWQKCLGQIELEVSKPVFMTWFKNSFILKEDTGTVTIGVPNEFVKDYLREKHQKLILRSLLQYSDNIRGLEFAVAKQNTTEPTTQKTKIQINKELPLQNLYINKDDNLNPKYTFETFIVGPFNELAYAASQAILTKPGMVYNPFFIYGNTGLGKTHLLQALGNSVKKNFPEKRVFYSTLEKFATDYITAVQTNKPNQFKEKYRKYDLLIIDDIQFISGKEKTQEELFHLFNAMYDANKQIIFSSDKHPNYIPGLEDRLKSRFSQGMIVDVSEPDFESRVAILKAKIKESNIPIDSDVVDYIASLIQGNIRELEGSLNAIVCQTELKRRALTLPEVKNLLKNNIKPKKNISMDEVVKTVATFYNLEEEIIYDKSRRKEIVHARQMVMYILREDFNISYPMIGQKLGGKDHTTVIHSYEKVKTALLENQNLSQELEQLRIMFK